MALGASGGQVLRLVLTQGLVLVATGLAAGVGATLLLAPVIASHLYGVDPTDPLTLASVCGVLVVVALAACLPPARQAVRIEPTVVLRWE
jgi:ABC-type lipoprotein release transport system permease subunit